VEKQVREKPIELNQNASRDGQPNGGNDWSRRQVLHKILHSEFSQMRQVKEQLAG
jgi:hypothetical protein